MISFDIKDAARLTEHLGGQIAEARRRGVASAGQRLVQVIQTRLIPAEDPPPVDQRAYAAGWDSQPTPEGADVFNTAPHAGVIEFGARADNVKIGRRMIDALAEWVVRKGLLGRGPGSHQGRSQEAEAQSAAWAIARSMQKRGIFNRGGGEGLGIARKAARLAPGIVAEEIRAELAELSRGR